MPLSKPLSYPTPNRQGIIAGWGVANPSDEDYGTPYMKNVKVNVTDELYNDICKKTKNAQLSNSLICLGKNIKKRFSSKLAVKCIYLKAVLMVKFHKFVKVNLQENNGIQRVSNGITTRLSIAFSDTKLL